jgi:hypothetical protein
VLYGQVLSSGLHNGVLPIVFINSTLTVTIPAVSRVAGLGAVRSLTIKGDTVYAGINTTTIRRIKVSTKALLTGIVVPGLTTGGTAGARWVTYSPTANSGAGGLYYGNFCFRD